MIATAGQTAVVFKCRCGAVIVRSDKASAKGHYCVECLRVAMPAGRVMLERVGWRVTP